MKIDLPVVSAQASIKEVRSRLESSGRSAILVKNGSAYGLVPQWKIITAIYNGKECAGDIQPEARFVAARAKKQAFAAGHKVRGAERYSTAGKSEVLYTNFRNRYASRQGAKYGVHVLTATEERAMISGPAAAVTIFALARKRCYCTNPQQKPPHDYDPGTDGDCFCGFRITC